METECRLHIETKQVSRYYGYATEKRLTGYDGDPETLVVPSGVVPDREKWEGLFEGKHLKTLSADNNFFYSIPGRLDGKPRNIRNLVIRLTEKKSQYHLDMDKLNRVFGHPETVEIQGKSPLRLSIDYGSNGQLLIRSNCVTEVMTYGKISGNLPVLYFPNTPPSAAQKPIRPGLMTAYLMGQFDYTDEQIQVYEQWLDKNRSSFFTDAVQSGYGELLERYLARNGDRRLFMPDTYDRLMELAEKKGNTALKAALMSAKGRHYNLAKVTEAREKREEEELDRPDSVRALKRYWNWKKEENGLTVTRYKGDGQEMSLRVPAVVPERIDGEEVTMVADGAFREPTSEEYILSSGIRGMGNNVFMGNHAVRNVEILGPVPYIPRKTFFQTTSLRRVVLKEGCRSIGMSAFKESGIREIEIPESLGRIGPRAFEDTGNLEKILAPGLTCLEEDAFSGSGIHSFSAPLLQAIPEHAFLCTPDLQTADVRRVCRIGREAFRRSAITELHVSGFLTEIGQDAFYASQLKTIVVHGRMDMRSMLREIRRVLGEKVDIVFLEDDLPI